MPACLPQSTGHGGSRLGGWRCCCQCEWANCRYCCCCWQSCWLAALSSRLRLWPRAALPSSCRSRHSRHQLRQLHCTTASCIVTRTGTSLRHRLKQEVLLVGRLAGWCCLCLVRSRQAGRRASRWGDHGPAVACCGALDAVGAAGAVAARHQAAAVQRPPAGQWRGALLSGDSGRTTACDRQSQQVPSWSTWICRVLRWVHATSHVSMMRSACLPPPAPAGAHLAADEEDLVLS